MKEWYEAFIKLLKSLSVKIKTTDDDSDNKVYASVGTSPESQQLIMELCGDIDEEYALRRELETEAEPEKWFDKKVDDALDDLAAAGVIETPTSDDYARAHSVIQEAIEEGVATLAEETAEELEKGPDSKDRQESATHEGKEE